MDNLALPVDNPTKTPGIEPAGWDLRKFGFDLRVAVTTTFMHPESHSSPPNLLQHACVIQIQRYHVCCFDFVSSAFHDAWNTLVNSLKARFNRSHRKFPDVLMRNYFGLAWLKVAWMNYPASDRGDTEIKP